MEILLLAGGAGFYIFPSLLAGILKNKNVLAISLLNLFLGWTIIGWVIALVWAVKK